MSWLILTIVAYMLTAGVAVSDKYFIERRVKSALAYGFSVGVLGLVFLVAAPWVLAWPSGSVLAAAFVSGAVFTFALVMLFWTLDRGDVSRVIPALGALFPIATLVLASLFLDERLAGDQQFAFAILIASTLLFSVSREKGEGNALVILAGAGTVAILYAVSSVLSKYVYANHPFLSGFIWMRLAGGAAALILLVVPSWRRKILGALERPGSGVGLLMGIRFVAGGAFLMLNYAVALGSVTLVNALKGVEYAAIFIITLVLSRIHPNIVRESFEKRLLTMKALGFAGIIAGLWMIAVSQK